MMSTNELVQFTATGGPMPAYTEQSVWEKSCPYGIQAPVLPPFRFTDDSIIAVMVHPEECYEDEKAKIHERHGFRFSRLANKLKGTRFSGSLPKCVFMPRREYLKHFARDGNGKYIGTETERRWSEKELDDSFKAYRNLKPRRWVLRSVNDRWFMEEDVRKT